MARRICKWLLLSVFSIALLVGGYDRIQRIYWVGSTDLEVEFVITDADSRHPIPGAQVEVFSELGNQEMFVLYSDSDGIARKDCPDSKSSGTQSGLRFTDTYCVPPPCWMYHVNAEGYEPRDWAGLCESDGSWRMQRTGRRQSKLEVAVSLKKSQP